MIAEPYRTILLPEVDLTQHSTHALVKRVALLQSLPACDRLCFLDLSAAFGALALQAGQRNQEADLFAYLAEIQLQLQSAFCEDIHDCTRTRPAAELLRTTVGFLHMIAELPLLKRRRQDVFESAGATLESTNFRGPSLASVHSDFWGLPLMLSPADEIETPCLDKMDTDPISPARALQIYRMLNTVGQILSRFGVEWFVSHGTLLGAIRHGGQIPHDCDLDISMFSWDLHKIRNASLMLALQRNGYLMDYLPVQNLFTVWRVGRHMGREVRGARALDNLNRYSPALHIFVLFDHQKRKAWEYETDRLKHQGWRLLQADLLPLQLRPFGSFTVPVPANPQLYLDRMYGDDWQSTIRSMTALEELDYFGPTPLKTTSMAQPTGPLEEVFFD